MHHNTSLIRVAALLTSLFLGAGATFGGWAYAQPGPLVYQAGWPIFAAGADIPAAPCVVDLDGNGAAELIVTAHDRLTVFGGDGVPWPGWPVANGPGERWFSPQLPVVGDITGDGIPEIVVAASRFEVRAYSLDGTVVPGWPRVVSPTSYSGYGRPAVADIDGDGVGEVVMQGLSLGVLSWAIWVLDGQGDLLPGWPVALDPEDLVFGGFAVGDIDFDGTAEVVTTGVRLGMFDTVPSPTYVLEADGQLRDGWPSTPTSGGGPERAAENPIVVDFDGSVWPSDSNALDLGDRSQSESHDCLSL